MGLSKQGHEAVQKGRVDAIATQVNTDRYPKMEKGLSQPLLGSHPRQTPDSPRTTT